MIFAGLAPRRALVLSPTPLHPADRPSRLRLIQTTSFLCAEGLEVDLVVHLREPDLASQPPCESVLSPAILNGRIFHVLTGETGTPANSVRSSAMFDICLGSLCRARRYHLMWICDASLARALAHAPGGCVTIIDMRGGSMAGSIGSARADIVVTETSAEATRIGKVFKVRTTALPWVPEAPARGLSRAVGEKLRVGFIGRGSPLNVETVRRFLQRLEANNPSLRDCLTFVVAGGVSRCLRPEPGWIEILGHVPSLAHFYDAIDIAVAPFATSVSARPQFVEALAWNVPVLSTAMASAALVTSDPAHAFPDIDTLVRCLAALANDRPRQSAIAAAASRGAAIIRRTRHEGLATLKRAISERRRRFIVVTDVAFWRTETFVEERCRQIIEYFAHAMPITVLYVGALGVDESEPRLARKLADVAVACLGGVAHIAPYLRALMAREPVAGSLMSLVDADPIPDTPLPRFLDFWPARAVAAAAARSAVARPDLQLDDGNWTFATPLFHLPERIDWNDDPGGPLLLLVLIGPDVDDALVDALWQASPVGLAIIRSRSHAADARFFGCLESMPRPAAIATIETGAIARELAVTLATRAGIACFHFNGDQYPVLVCGRVIGNLVQHITAIADQLRDCRASPAQGRSVDQGWSRLWPRFACNPVASRAKTEKPSCRVDA